MSDILVTELLRFGLVVNVVGCINEVNQRRARLVLGLVTVFKKTGKLSLYVTSHPGQLSLAIPSAGRQNEYWRWLRPSPGKKRRVLRNSRPCYQDCWHTDPVRYLADLESSHASDLAVYVKSSSSSIHVCHFNVQNFQKSTPRDSSIQTQMLIIANYQNIDKKYRVQTIHGRNTSIL